MITYIVVGGIVFAIAWLFGASKERRGLIRYGGAQPPIQIPLQPPPSGPGPAPFDLPFGLEPRGPGHLYEPERPGYQVMPAGQIPPAVADQVMRVAQDAGATPAELQSAANLAQQAGASQTAEALESRADILRAIEDTAVPPVGPVEAPPAEAYIPVEEEAIPDESTAETEPTEPISDDAVAIPPIDTDPVGPLDTLTPGGSYNPEQAKMLAPRVNAHLTQVARRWPPKERSGHYDRQLVAKFLRMAGLPDDDGKGLYGGGARGALIAYGIANPPQPFFKPYVTADYPFPTHA